MRLRHQIMEYFSCGVDPHTDAFTSTGTGTGTGTGGDAAARVSAMIGVSADDCCS